MFSKSLFKNNRLLFYLMFSGNFWYWVAVNLGFHGCKAAALSTN